MEYCVYITTYTGTKMPLKYIGSSSLKRVNSGYRGSVSSKKWKDIWLSELLVCPERFTTEIVSLHINRIEALTEELRLQIEYDAIKSSDWINEGYAQINGYAGRDVSGENNPMYGRGDQIREWCKNNPELASERSRKAATTQWSNPLTSQSKRFGMLGKLKTRKTLTEEEFLKMQQLKSKLSLLKTCCKIEYIGIIYLGWLDLLNKTGVTKHLYKKYYVNGLDPLVRKGTNGPIKNINLKGGS